MTTDQSVRVPSRHDDECGNCLRPSAEHVFHCPEPYSTVWNGAAAAPAEPVSEFVRVPREANVRWSGNLKCKYPDYSNYALQKIINDVLAAAPAEQPVDMVLHCPRCQLQHIDAPDERTPDWKNPPHKSHLCHGCRLVWRVADAPTNGVKSLPSGKDLYAEQPAPQDYIQGLNDALRIVSEYLYHGKSQPLTDAIADLQKFIDTKPKAAPKPTAWQTGNVQTPDKALADRWAMEGHTVMPIYAPATQDGAEGGQPAAEVDSRSRLRRVAAQKGEPIPTFETVAPTYRDGVLAAAWLCERERGAANDEGHHLVATGCTLCWSAIRALLGPDATKP